MSWGPHPKVRAPAHIRVSGENDVLSRRALLALRDVEVHLLAFEQLAEALGGDVRVVGEDVSAATVLLDEAETLFRVEPLHGARCHVKSPLGQCPKSTLCGLRVAAMINPPGNDRTFKTLPTAGNNRRGTWSFREPQLQLEPTVARREWPRRVINPSRSGRLRNPDHASFGFLTSRLQIFARPRVSSKRWCSH